MRLTPADVRNVAFKKPSIGKRGYDEDEVDAFLDLVEVELSRLIEENNDLAQRLAACEANSGNAGDAAVDNSADGVDTGYRPADNEYAADESSEQVEAVVETVPEPEVEPEPQPEPQPAAAPAPAQTGSYADHHVHAARLLGLAEETAQRLTSEAQQHADSTKAAADAEAQRLVSEAQAEADRLVSDATNRSEQLVGDANARAEATNKDSEERAAAMDAEAQRKYSEVMDQLTTQRTSLEKKIDELRTYEREYRSRLKGWITEQLAQLDETGSATQSADS